MSRLQEDADSGRIGGMIKNIMGRPQPFTMESIRDGDGIITDGATIAKMITAFFSDWFARLPAERKTETRGLLIVLLTVTNQLGIVSSLIATFPLQCRTIYGQPSHQRTSLTTGSRRLPS